MNKHACVNKPTYNFSGKPYPLFFTHWVTRMSIGNTIRWGMGNVCISVWALTAWVVNHFPISTHTFFFVKKKCPYPILNVVYWQINYSSYSFTLFGWLWLVAGADLLWEKNTTDWLVASTDLMWEKSTAAGCRQNRVSLLTFGCDVWPFVLSLKIIMSIYIVLVLFCH